MRSISLKGSCPVDRSTKSVGTPNCAMACGWTPLSHSTHRNTKPCTQSNTVKPSEIAGYSKHQALHTVKHSKTLRNGRIQQIPSPAHKHIGKPSGMAGHSQTPSPAHSQTHRQTLREGRTQSNTKHTVKHIGKHFGMAVYNKLPLTAALNIASLTWWKTPWQRCLWSLWFLIYKWKAVHAQIFGDLPQKHTPEAVSSSTVHQSRRLAVNNGKWPGHIW